MHLVKSEQVPRSRRHRLSKGISHLKVLSGIGCLLVVLTEPFPIDLVVYNFVHPEGVMIKQSMQAAVAIMSTPGG